MNIPLHLLVEEEVAAAVAVHTAYIMSISDQLL